jgi:nucleotide-binding universal stress UspA family protein
MAASPRPSGEAAAGTARPHLVAHAHRDPAFERIVVPVCLDGGLSIRAVETAARVASKGTTVVLVSVLEVPRELPLDALFQEEEEEVRAQLRRAGAIVESYGVHAVQQLERAYSAAPTVLRIANEYEADLIVLGAPTRPRSGRSAFGHTATAILHKASCRVMLLTVPSASPG